MNQTNEEYIIENKMANTPKLTNEQLIDLLADGNNIPAICRMYGMKKFTLDRRMETLKKKHNCRTSIQLVVKLKIAGISTSVAETK